MFCPEAGRDVLCGAVLITGTSGRHTTSVPAATVKLYREFSRGDNVNRFEAFLLGLTTGCALIATCALLAPSVKADTDDDTFLQAMNYGGIWSDLGSADLIRLAHLICDDRANGYSDLMVAAKLNKTEPDLGMNHAGYFVAVAEHVYCPQFSSQRS